MQYVFLSHDVDWPRNGAPLEHIMARRDRFDKNTIGNVTSKNPYYNIPEYMEIEEKFGIRSTFFFRTIYENGYYSDYESDIQSLIKGGWEIGLHLDPNSINSIELISAEKAKIEEIARTKLQGNRVHYLGFNEELPEKLKSLGFEYDSTVRKTKDKIDQNEMGFRMLDGIVEFPITLMDAYMFTYMKIPEDKIVQTFNDTLSMSRKINFDFNIITVIWHDNVLKMKGGRMYQHILEYLTSQKDVKICRGIDLARMVNKI